jgi:MmyB-like transcription regulator ligand binding domain
VLRPNPAYVLSRTNDLLAANPAGFHLLPGLAEWPARQRNTIRYTFLHPAARALWPDWEQKARAASRTFTPWPAPTPMPPIWRRSSAS